MRLFDRFTRDEVSAKVWWPLALLGLIALIASVPLANRAADATRRDAAQHAAIVSQATIQPLTTSGASAADLSGAAAGIVAADPTLAAVRVWDASHRLVASSDSADQLLSGEAMNDNDIDQALSNGSDWLVTDRTMSGDAGPATFSAYSAIRGSNGSVVTQFEAADAVLLANVHHEWMWFRIVVGLGTLLLFALALLSMREPLARIGAGVPFYAENAPPWLRVMDVDRAIALEQAGDRAKDRLAGLQARLDESERLRLRAEGELQQALAGVPVAARVAAPVVVPDPVREQARAARPSPEAAAAVLAAAEEKKRARAVAAEEKQRVKAEAAAAAAEEKRRASVAAAEQEQRAKAAAAAAAEWAAQQQAQPALEPEPMPVPVAAPARPDDVTVTVEADDLAITASAADPDEPEAEASSWPEVIVLPEPQPAKVAPGSAAGGSDPDREARDVLERLVPETAEHHPVDDTSDLRSRLARTAALKKPGSRERQEGREDLPH